MPLANFAVVLAACPDTPLGRRDAALITVMREAMLRAAEAADLRWTEVSQLDLSTVCLSRLERWQAVAETVPRRTSWQLVFGLSVRSIRYVVGRAGERAGIDWVVADSMRYGLMADHGVLVPQSPGRQRYVSPAERERMWQELVQHSSEAERRRCESCSRYKYQDDFVVDHLRPVAKGGVADAENLQMICGGCNGRKRRR